MASLDAAQAQASELCTGESKTVPLSVIKEARAALQELPGLSLLEDCCKGVLSALPPPCFFSHNDCISMQDII